VPPILPSVQPPSAGLYRIGRADRAPFAAPDWRYAGDGRFDDPRLKHLDDERDAPDGCFLTIYLADSRIVAFRELLQGFRPRIDLLMDLRRTTREPESAGLAGDLAGAYDLSGSVRGIVHREWRWRRKIAHIALEGHSCADLTSPDAWTHLMHVPELQEIAVEEGISSIDVSTMTSMTRRFTQACARYVYERVDGDGIPEFAGIRYLSRFGSPGNWMCWAMFDDRLSRARAGSAREIDEDDDDLIAVAHQFGLIIEADDGSLLRRG
jgi:hypothetical protein